MNVPFFRILFCIFVFGLTLYAYIHKKNALTHLRVVIPKIEKELRKIDDENIGLEYDLERFLDPSHLLIISRQPEYSHLIQSKRDEIVEIAK